MLVWSRKLSSLPFESFGGEQQLDEKFALFRSNHILSEMSSVTSARKSSKEGE